MLLKFLSQESSDQIAVQCIKIKGYEISEQLYKSNELLRNMVNMNEHTHSLTLPLSLPLSHSPPLSLSFSLSLPLSLPPPLSYNVQVLKLGIPTDPMLPFQGSKVLLRILIFLCHMLHDLGIIHTSRTNAYLDPETFEVLSTDLLRVFTILCTGNFRRITLAI